MVDIHRDCDAAALAHPLAVGGLAPVLRPVPARHVGQLQRGAAGGHLAILVPQPLLLMVLRVQTSYILLDNARYLNWGPGLGLAGHLQHGSLHLDVCRYMDR